MPPYKTESTLRRGAACLSCRKRKLKCDGIRPVCQQCEKMNRSSTCEYDDKQQKSRTQLLKEQLAMLEKRLQELESNSRASKLALAAELTSDIYSPLAKSHSSPFGSFPLNSDPHPENLSRSPVSVPPFNTNTRSPSLTSSSSSSDNATPFLPGISDGLRPYYRNPSSEPSTAPWDVRHALSPESKKYLLDVFTAHKHQCWFYCSMDRFYQTPYSLSYSEEPHPALMNAILLLGCHFAQSPHYSEMESSFFTQALHEINTALDTSDRLIDIVQASSLLAIYLYTNHRILEGYRHAFSAIRLAVGLGLHQICPLDVSAALGLPQQSPLIPLPAPQNHIELTDRISAFWQIFMVDRCWSVVNGLPLALPDKENSQTRIQTPWPVGMEDFEWEDHSIKGPVQMLFEGGSDFPSSLHIPALKAKAAALYELTAHFKADKNDWAGYYLAESCLQRFSSIIPSLPANYDTAGHTSPVFDHEHFMIQTMIYASFIHLKQGVPFDERAFKAANSMVRLIHQLNESDYQFIDPIISACWYSASKIFICSISDISKMDTYNSDIGNIVTTSNQGLEVLNNALKFLGAFSPLSSNLALKLELSRNHSRMQL